jgi:hypothetical protein
MSALTIYLGFNQGNQTVPWMTNSLTQIFSKKEKKGEKVEALPFLQVRRKRSM